MNKIQLGFSALGLENLHNDLLLLDQEGADDLLPDGLVAEHSTVRPVHSLQTLGQAGLLLVTVNRAKFNKVSASDFDSLTWRA